MTEEIYAVLNHRVCGSCDGCPRKLTLPPSPAPPVFTRCGYFYPLNRMRLHSTTSAQPLSTFHLLYCKASKLDGLSLICFPIKSIPRISCFPVFNGILMASLQWLLLPQKGNPSSPAQPVSLPPAPPAATITGSLSHTELLVFPKAPRLVHTTHHWSHHRSPWTPSSFSWALLLP